MPSEAYDSPQVAAKFGDTVWTVPIDLRKHSTSLRDKKVFRVSHRSNTYTASHDVSLVSPNPNFSTFIEF